MAHMHVKKWSSTPAENIVLELVYEWLGERRCNRTMGEYVEIALRLPKTAAIHAYVNQRLRKFAQARENPRSQGVCAWTLRAYWPYQICDFRAGDQRIQYRDFPSSISRETVRTAVKKSGLMELRAWAQGEMPDLFVF